MLEPTLNSRLSSAELCRRNGWGRGTLLTSGRTLTAGGYVPPVRLEITAVGDTIVLARDRDSNEEQAWNLTIRDWQLALHPRDAGGRGERLDYDGPAEAKGSAADERQ